MAVIEKTSAVREDTAGLHRHPILGALVIPIWVSGTPQTHWMPWHFLLPSRSTVTFGQPFKPDPKLTHQQTADNLRAHLLQLADG